ncbi:MAG: amidase [Pseudomonadota bacterium]|nr:amidase [Pseudomonadota bacterium]
MAYTPRLVRAPRLAGLPLRAFSSLVGTPGVGAVIRDQLLAQIGIPRLRAAPVAHAAPARPAWLDAGAPSPDEVPTAPAAPATAGYAHPSIADYAEAYRSGRADPVAVARAARAARTEHDGGNQPLRAFIAMESADLLAQAEASAARLRAGTPRSWLEGVPVAVKDELDQSPYGTTVGTRFLGKEPATADATVVARLRAAGALLVGKTNMHELGIGVTGINPHHGAARNPYDPGRATGGSSSGSAAAAAAGFCPVAIGADGGGSIRIPAALCGMVGLKPTFGRVSEHGASPLCWSVAHVGPIGAHAVDVAAIYGLIAGADAHDPGSLGHPGVRLPGARASDAPKLRVGVLDAWFEHADPAVVEACHVLLENLGVTLVRVDLPDPDLVRLAHLVLIVGEMAAAQLPHAAPTYGPDTAMNFALARGLTASDYTQALRVRAHLAEGWRTVFEQVDLVATPTTGCTAPPIQADALGGESDMELLDRIMRFAHAPNLFGFPAVSIPAGYDAADLPIGLQLIGRPWSEDVLLGVAIQAAPLVERRRPKILANLLG